MFITILKFGPKASVAYLSLKSKHVNLLAVVAIKVLWVMESDLVQNSSAKNLSVSTNLDQHQPLFYNTFNKLNQHQ